VADSPRITDLRRRVQQDPASLSFAPLAEELRRAGRFDEAVSVCRAGLALHPEYASARATLGRALLELGDVDAAFLELSTALGGAPGHLGALRGVADIHRRRGELSEALEKYQLALTMVGRDPDLERIVADLERELAASQTPPSPPPPSTRAVGAADLARQVTLRRLERFLGAVLADRARRDAGPD
jgi:tetratricopeptide (TPR) repeat protein